MSTVKRLDIIIFGGSGFTGKRVIVQLTKLIKSENLKLTWGIAGRSEEKLKNVLLEMHDKMDGTYSNNIPKIIADVNDHKSLVEMTAKARIIINTVGPFDIYGESVVQACIKTGTHLVDICGVSYVETGYFDKIQTRYDDVAKEKGIYLVSACALDDLPADLGSVLLQRHFKGTLNSIDTYLSYWEEKNYPGAIAHYTTYESMVRGFARTIKFKEALRVLSPCRRSIFKSRVINKWCIEFPGSDYSILLKTQQHMYKAYKRKPVPIKNHLGCRHFLELVCTLIFFPIISLLSRFVFTRNILLKHPKFFTWCQVSHDGPSEEKQEAMHFHSVLVGKGYTEKDEDETVVVRVSGRNPGYRATCLIAALSAITVLTENKNMPGNGGCYSPGAAFADTLIIDKLNKYGIKFELNPQLLEF